MLGGQQMVAMISLQSVQRLGLQPGDVHLNISSPGWAKHAWSNVFAPWNAEATVYLYNYTRFNANLALTGGHEYVKVFPRPGQMLIFPASVWHSVTPQQGDARRLSVAANFRVEPRDKPPRFTFPLRVEGERD